MTVCGCVWLCVAVCGARAHFVAASWQGTNFPWRPQPVWDILASAAKINVAGGGEGTLSKESHKYYGCVAPPHALAWCQASYVCSRHGLQIVLRWCVGRSGEAVCAKASRVVQRRELARGQLVRGDLRAVRPEGGPVHCLRGQVPVACTPVPNRAEAEAVAEVRVHTSAAVLRPACDDWSVVGRYKVDRIPRLVIINGEGHVVCEDACTPLIHDVAGTNFPWPDKCVYTMLDEHRSRQFAGVPTAILLLDGVRDEYVAAGHCRCDRYAEQCWGGCECRKAKTQCVAAFTRVAEHFRAARESTNLLFLWGDGGCCGMGACCTTVHGAHLPCVAGGVQRRCLSRS